MGELLKHLDLDQKGLFGVKKAFERSNLTKACEMLLDYYRQGETAEFLRKERPMPSKGTDSEADSIVRNIFTFYKQTGNVPTGPDGHLDWTYDGPADDMEWAWALNRHHHLGILLNAYLNTGNPKYAKTIDRHIKDWVISSLPYPGEKSSTAMWRGLEVSFREKRWARVYYGLMHSDAFTPAARLLLLSSIPEHAHYLRHFHAEHGNWLTMEMSGLAMVSAAWPEFDQSPSWLTYAKSEMLEGLKRQVYPDGAQAELTSSYHRVALSNFNAFVEICRDANEPVSDLFSKKLEQMWNYLAYTMRPNGYGLLNNDANHDYNRDRIIEAAKQYNRYDWRYISTNGDKGLRPEGLLSVLFPWAGHLITRSGYHEKAQWSFFDIGPWGIGHQHNDKLHISISAYGRDLLTDCGRFAYRGEIAEKFRPYARSSFAHNVIIVDGQGQGPGSRRTDEPLAEKHYKITSEFDYAWSSFDRYNEVEGEVVHTRALFYVRGEFWVVVDRITTDRPREIKALWHWHPDCKVSVSKEGNISTDNKQGNLEIIPVDKKNWNIAQVKGQEDPQPQGWYSKEYNEAEPAPASICSTEINGDTSFAWLLYPSEGQVDEPEVSVLSRDNNGVKVLISEPGGTRWKVNVPYSDATKAGFSFSSGSVK